MNATCKICGHGEQWHSKRHGCERWVGSLVCHCREFVASAEESERPRGITVHVDASAALESVQHRLAALEQLYRDADTRESALVLAISQKLDARDAQRVTEFAIRDDVRSPVRELRRLAQNEAIANAIAE